ncbi:alpha-hydroxy-acid oxidizing protein [Roseococcus sp. SYP-B2431]|uniref:alpha-hydroxy acid oxidase n=1 Tax=Roseococcus sp. SYP-B2431 TaxID=2496640 RepID=UPI00103F9F30|nr:alpha-hydroxy acid oxidase [Roseococcus sp. SYP-B2431]TCI00847.1 alpha-hydroxy-acid oxidizing protein [Roseococcus sp. SYP-B2431]
MPRAVWRGSGQTLQSRAMSSIARRALCLDDFEELSRRRLPRPIFGYIAGATERNAALEDSASAYSEFHFLPRVLRDVSPRSYKRTIFNREWDAPFGIAPMGMAALVAYRGDIALARAARAANVPYILSGSSLIRMEEVIAANPDAWFQAYLPGNATRVEALVDRVAAAGFGTLLVTVDTAVLPSRENNVRNGFSTPLKPSLRLAWDGMLHPRWTFGSFLYTWAKHGMPHFENSFAERGAPILARNVLRDFTARDHLNWEHLALIRKRWPGWLIVKGVMHPDDARRAEAEGADGIVVSNHGGRQLDGTAGTLRVLPEIAAASGQMTVLFDGGLRRGTDVLKALSLGAHFCFFGRPMLYAASVAQEEGVSHAISLMKGELDRDMALLGVNTLDELGPHVLLRTSGVG